MSFDFRYFPTQSFLEETRLNHKYFEGLHSTNVLFQMAEIRSIFGHFRSIDHFVLLLGGQQKCSGSWSYRHCAQLREKRLPHI